MFHVKFATKIMAQLFRGIMVHFIKSDCFEFILKPFTSMLKIVVKRDFKKDWGELEMN